MALCVCGLKVERLQCKLQCIICKQILHAECCNIKKDELEFVKDSYKCNKCLRRSSVSPLPIKSIADIVDSPCSPTGGSEDTLNHVARDTSADIIAKTVVPSLSIDIVPATDNIYVGSPATTTSAQVNNQTAHTSADTSTLDALFAEMKSLRKSNENLITLVSSLVSDKDKLLTTVEELKMAVQQMQKSLNSKNNSTDCSPKRKKTELKVTKKIAGQNVSLPVTNMTTTAFTDNAQLPAIASADHKDPPPARSFASLLRPSTNEQNGNEIPNLNDWKVVSNKSSATTVEGRRRPKKPIVIGLGDNPDLNVIDKKKWLHLSSFKNTVSSDDIMTYVEKNFGISRSHMACYKLVKMNAVISDLKYVNFKLGISSCFVEKLFDASRWPANIKIRHFDFLEKPVDLK